MVSNAAPLLPFQRLAPPHSESTVLTPDQVRLLIRRSGLEIVKESCTAGEPCAKSPNVYYNRDYLAVLKKKGDWRGGETGEAEEAGEGKV